MSNVLFHMLSLAVFVLLLLGHCSHTPVFKILENAYLFILLSQILEIHRKRIECQPIVYSEFL